MMGAWGRRKLWDPKSKRGKKRTGKIACATEGAVRSPFSRDAAFDHEEGQRGQATDALNRQHGLREEPQEQAQEDEQEKIARNGTGGAHSTWCVGLRGARPEPAAVALEPMGIGTWAAMVSP